MLVDERCLLTIGGCKWRCDTVFVKKEIIFRGNSKVVKIHAWLLVKNVHCSSQFFQVYEIVFNNFGVKWKVIV